MRMAAPLAAAAEIVGARREYDYRPEAVADPPRLTPSAIPHGLKPAEIDAEASARRRRGFCKEMATFTEPGLGDRKA